VLNTRNYRGNSLKISPASVSGADFSRFNGKSGRLTRRSFRQIRAADTARAADFPDAAILMHRDSFAAMMFHVKFRHSVHSVHSQDDSD
jgi:hypothetical protein